MDMPPIPNILPQPFEWCFIPAGEVTTHYGKWEVMEQYKNVKMAGLPPREYVVSHSQTFSVDAFFMAKYPITNDQFDVFDIALDGYENPAWFDFCAHSQRLRSTQWWSPKALYEGKDVPRSVGLYNSIAFCRWLSHKTGLQIVVPTEQQWQRAAQGDDNRHYPYGNTFDPEKCTFQQPKPRPVTQYVGVGDSPFGVSDMSGNVNEWTISTWAGGNIPLSELHDDKWMTRKGGVHNSNNPLEFCVDVRRANSPDAYLGMGLRIACIP